MPALVVVVADESSPDEDRTQPGAPNVTRSRGSAIGPQRCDEIPVRSSAGRVAAADVPTPYAKNLEALAVPNAERIVESVLKITL